REVAVEVEHGFERLELPRMHIGPREFDVPQGRRLERAFEVGEVRIEVTQSIATRRGTPRPITAIRALEHAPRPLGAAPVDVGDAHGRGQAEVVKLTVGEHWTVM